MPGKRIPELIALSGAGSANNDDVVIFDADAGVTKRISRSQLAEGMVEDLPFLYFHGVLTSNPTQRLNGDSLEIGDGYLRSSDMIFRYYTSSGWQNYEQIAIAAAQAWAEGTLPGGAGTKSSREWSLISKDWAEKPENVAVEPGKFSALHHSAKAQGYANVAGSAIGFFDREDLTALLADNTLTYTLGQTETVSAGDIIRTRHEGFAYEVALSGATDQHITTAGGVRLYEAWPFSTKARLKVYDPANLPNGYTVPVVGHVWEWDDTVPVQVHQADTRERFFVSPDPAQDGAWVSDEQEESLPAWDQIKMRMALGRVDFVGIGDSNQAFGGHGWDHGFQYALSQRFPMYATGLISFNENDSNGQGIGYLYNYNAASPTIGVTTGAPAFFDDYLDYGAEVLAAHNYGYLATGSYSGAGNSGMVVNAACPINTKAALAFDFHYGTFASGSGGSFQGQVRIDAAPFTTLVSSSVTTTTTGTDSMQILSLSISADPARTQNLGMRWGTNANDINAPFFGLWTRVHNPSHTIGFSYHTLVYRGGQGLRVMALSLQGASNTTLEYYFGECRRLQGSNKTVVFCVNSGLNDRNETNTSVGPAAITDGDSAAAFVDNFVAIKERIEQIWDNKSWDPREIYWLIFPSHPVDDPDNSELLAYRKAIAQYAKLIPRAQVVDLEQLTDEAEMLT
jgi:hypothetical protein